MAGLRVPVDSSPADWLVRGVRDFDHTVGSLVPDTFDRFARVFHPASLRSCEGDEEVRWAAVAAANRRVMHPAAEWGSLTGSWQLREQQGVWDQQPRQGELPLATAETLAAILAPHTADPARWWFGVWEGGRNLGVMVLVRRDLPDAEAVRSAAQQEAEDEIAAWEGLLDSAPSFELPGRPMRLLQGGPEALAELHADRRHSPPALWWPADRAWCVATDVDLMTTYVGGGAEAIDALLGDERIEALAVGPDQLLTWDSDAVNPLPAPP